MKDTSRILMLERELKLNKINILRCNDGQSKEYTGLLLQRSNLKDMLLEEYRGEVLERRKDYEYIGNNQD